jgi:hypothetical protein
MAVLAKLSLVFYAGLCIAIIIGAISSAREEAGAPKERHSKR